MFSGGGTGSRGKSVVVIADVISVVMSMGGVVQGIVVRGGGVDHGPVVNGGGVVPDVMVYSRVVDSGPVVSVVGSLVVVCVEDVDPGFV